MANSYAINNEAPITEFNLKTTANASQGKGGTCNGDSGGPVFFYGTNVIAAVTSFGQNGQCKGQDFSYRLDRPEVPELDHEPEPARRRLGLLGDDECRGPLRRALALLLAGGLDLEHRAGCRERRRPGP